MNELKWTITEKEFEILTTAKEIAERYKEMEDRADVEDLNFPYLFENGQIFELIEGITTLRDWADIKD